MMLSRGPGMVYYFPIFLCFLASMAFAAPIDLDRIKSSTSDTTFRIIEYDPNSPYLKFTVPCTTPDAFSDRKSQLHTPLIFELSTQGENDEKLSRLSINGNIDEIRGSGLDSEEVLILRASDISGIEHEVELISQSHTTPANGLLSAAAGGGSDDGRIIHRRFLITSIDRKALLLPIDGFSIVLEHTPQARFISLKSETHSSSIDLRSWHAANRGNGPLEPTQGDARASSFLDESYQGFIDDAKSLLQLEIQAKAIQQQILEKQQHIGDYIKAQRDSISLSRLIHQCESLSCTAQVVAQRISDRVGLVSKPSVQLSTITESDAMSAQTVFASDADGKSQNSDTMVQGLRILLSKNETTGEYSFVNMIDPLNPFIRGLQLACSALGFIVIFSTMRNKCMSLRRRTERAADLEQSRATRDYRHAARKAACHGRWKRFLAAFCCFSRQDEEECDVMEEKRALIVQDAFLEEMNDPEQAEKCEIMEAEIRELRYAHDIVSRLVRADDRGFALSNDLPPSLIPLPHIYTSRSRASTMTLPSYTSECLPGYSSGPDDLHSLLDYQSESDDYDSDSDSSDTCTRSVGFSTLSHSGHQSRYSPTSSIVDVSPRLSEETMCDYFCSSQSKGA